MNQIVAVILAAGSSKRLGFNKLCLKVDGEPVIRRTARLFTEVADKVVVVTGFERERIERELIGMPVLFAHNGDHHQGMSSSVRTALPYVTGMEGALFHLGDKPFVVPSTIERIVEAFREGGKIVVPLFNGQKGHPVLVRGRLFLEEMATVEGDMGLRRLVERHADLVRTVEGDEGTVLDIDSEEDIAELAGRGFRIEKS
jgi:molybdenum cofactor cytidylyltransferase